jgi:hypothetical protein
VLTHHPFGHLVVAADEVLQGVFLHHPAHADLAGLLRTIFFATASAV